MSKFDWIETKGGWNPYLRPKNLESVLANINRFDEDVPEDARIYAAMAFHNEKTGKLIWAKIGVEPMPNPKDGWKLEDYGEVPHLEFVELMSEGTFTFAMRMLYHDYVGHILGIQLNADYMAAMIRYYKHLKKSGNQNDVDQVDLLTEYLSLPNLAAAARIREIFPASFATPGVLNVEEVFKTYKSFDSQKEKIKFLAESGESLISRLDGALSGGQDIDHPEERWIGNGREFSIYASGNSFLPSLGSRSTVGSIAAHSLYYILLELRSIDRALNKIVSDPEQRRIWNTLLEDDAEAAFKDRLLRRLATLEATMTNAVKLDIRPGAILDFVVNGRPKNSNVEKYLRSYLEPSSPWHKILLAR